MFLQITLTSMNIVITISVAKVQGLMNNASSLFLLNSTFFVSTTLIYSAVGDNRDRYRDFLMTKYKKR